jgi:DNA adenine methylase
VYQRIISQQPPHEVYIEPFLGFGAIMRRKLPARVNIGIDADVDPISRARAMWDLDTWLDSATAGAGGGIRFEFAVADAVDWMDKRQWTGRELVYCDPPYLLAARSCARRIYRYELNVPGHIALLAVVTRLPCMVQVSGYWSELYATTLAGWRSISFQAQTRGGWPATEWLWMNYPEPVELHDYRYLGRDFRERARLKRLHTRWLARLQRMGVLERGALLSAISAAWPDRRVSGEGATTNYGS